MFHDAKDSKDARKQAKVHEVSYGQEDSIGKIFNIGNLSAEKAMITLRFKNGEKEQFQIGTGADRTMLPLRVYKRVTGDYKLKNVVRRNDFVRNYGDERLPIWGTAIIRAWKQDGYTARLECHVIEGDRFNTSLLSKRAIRDQGPRRKPTGEYHL